MKLKLKLKDIKNSQGAIKLLSITEINNASFAFKLVRIMKILKDQFEIYLKTKEKYVLEFSEKDDNGKPIYTLDKEKSKRSVKFSDENFMKFDEKVKELEETEIEIEFPGQKIKIQEIEKNIKTIAPCILMDLQFLIEDK